MLRAARQDDKKNTQDYGYFSARLLKQRKKQVVSVLFRWFSKLLEGQSRCQCRKSSWRNSTSLCLASGWPGLCGGSNTAMWAPIRQGYVHIVNHTVNHTVKHIANHIVKHDACRECRECRETWPWAFAFVAFVWTLETFMPSYVVFTPKLPGLCTQTSRILLFLAGSSAASSGSVAGKLWRPTLAGPNFSRKDRLWLVLRREWENGMMVGNGGGRTIINGMILLMDINGILLMGWLLLMGWWLMGEWVPPVHGSIVAPGSTALMYAAHGGHEDVCTTLLEAPSTAVVFRPWLDLLFFLLQCCSCSLFAYMWYTHMIYSGLSCEWSMLNLGFSLRVLPVLWDIVRFLLCKTWSC